MRCFVRYQLGTLSIEMGSRLCMAWIACVCPLCPGSPGTHVGDEGYYVSTQLLMTLVVASSISL